MEYQDIKEAQLDNEACDWEAKIKHKIKISCGVNQWTLR